MNKKMPFIKRGTPVLDGHLDELYLDSHCVDEPPMEHLYYALKDDETVKKYMSNTSGKTYYLFDDKYVYACAVIHDETICSRGAEWRMNTTWPWNDDGAEVYFYFSDEDVFAVHADAHNIRAVVDEHIYFDRHSDLKYHDLPREDWVATIDEENKNYTVEMRIPLPDYVKEGSVIGTLLEIDDRWTVENDPDEAMVGAIFSKPQYPGDEAHFVRLGE